MNFKQHFRAAFFISIINILLFIILSFSKSFLEFSKSFSEINFQEPILYFNVFIITLFTATAPDLDTASIPQRWFYRISFFSLLILLIYKELLIFIIIALYIHIPLLDKHRGLTHNKLTPLFFYITILLILEYVKAEKKWFYNFKFERVIDSFFDYYVYGWAIFTGHYTHLFLDRKKPKRKMSKQ